MQHFCIHYFSEKTACFPYMATVKLKNGKLITMSELQRGDQVQTGNGKELNSHFC